MVRELPDVDPRGDGIRQAGGRVPDRGNPRARVRWRDRFSVRIGRCRPAEDTYLRADVPSRAAPRAGQGRARTRRARVLAAAAQSRAPRLLPHAIATPAIGQLRWI